MNSRVNSGRGFLVPQEIDVQIGGPWMPLTPGKPILARPNGIPVERQVNQPGRTNWHNLAGVPDRGLQQTTNYQGMGQNFNLRGSLGQNGSCYDLRVSGAEKGGSDHNVGSYTQSFGNDSTIWDNNPLAELFATKNGEATSRNTHESKAPTILNSYSQVDSSWTEGNFTRLLTMGCDDPNPGSNHWINSDRLLPQMTNNGFPVPFRPNYNPNSPPRSEADATSSTANSFPFAPVTPDHAKQFENQRCSAMPSFSVEESSSQEKDKLENLLTSEAVENHSNELLQNIVGSSAAAVSIPLSENNNFEGRDQGIDLNKTPQLKAPKRRKHRPKVIVEGKPKRVPKSKTSKNNNSKENPSGKRKYVRKKSLNAPVTQQTDATNEATVLTFEPKAKMCRRKLSFDSEDRKGESQGKAASLLVKIHEENQEAFNLNLDSQGSELCTRINSVGGAESAVKKVQNGYKEGYQQAVSACTLKHSVNQMSHESTRLPERGAPAGSPGAFKNNALNAIARSLHMRNVSPYQLPDKNGYSYGHQHLQGELNRHISLPRNAHQNLEEIRQMMWQNTPHMVERNMANSNEKRGLKREYHHEIRLPGLSAENQMSYPFTCQDIYQVDGQINNSHDFCTRCSETHKKKITENGFRTTAGSTPCVKVVGDGSREVAPEFYSRMLDSCFGDDKTFKKLKNGANGTCGDRCFHSPTSEHNTQKQLTASELHTETMAEKRPSRSTQVHSITSLIAMTNSHLASSTPPEKAPTSGYEQGIEAYRANMSVKRCNTTQTSSNLVSSCINKVLLQEHKDGSHDCQQFSLKTRGHPDKQDYSVTIDEIMCRLQGLNITGRSKETVGQEQNAIVSYKGYGTMVPYEAFDLIKKRKPRPKVNLDPETNRIWKLLMGGEGIEGTEADAKNKEKWWEEERKVFRGRADSFIARMHLVQGDRRFSQWKGSVVDSVIGVFLTQNVSDHLSSSAFMSLAARFPLRSTTPDQTCYQSGTSILAGVPEIKILDPDGTIKCHEKILRQSGHEQPSVAYHESSRHRTEDRSSGAGRTSLATEHIGIVEENASSSQNSSYFFVFQANKEMQSCSRTEEPTSVAGRTSLATEHSGILEEKASSSQNSSDFFVFQVNKEMQSCSGSTSEAEDLAGGKPNKMYGSPTLLQTRRTAPFQVFHSPATGSLYFDDRSAHWHKQSEDIDYNLEIPRLDKFNNLKNSSTFTHPTNSNISRIQGPTFPSQYFKLHMEPELTTQEVGYLGMSAEESISSSPSTASGITRGKGVDRVSRRIDHTAERKRKTAVQQNGVPMIQPPTIDPSAFLTKHLTHQESCSQSTPHIRKDQHFFSTHQQERSATFQVESVLDKEPIRPTEAVATAESGTRQEVPNNPKYTREALSVEKRTTAGDKPRFLGTKAVEANAKEQVYFSGETPTGMSTNMLNARKGKAEGEKRKPFDWDCLRKQVQPNGRRKERSKGALDSLDYEAIRCADVNEIANAIKERGMNNMLAERIKAFLNRLVEEHGSIDLEWLRDVPPDKAKDYLLSVRGLGLKSVECVRLLSLHHLAFPVDTNVGRIAVRLGWVPLQPLPESLQLHLLELYPVLESIQKYLWPRLCKLDQRTLYELHYQMITFGKVFCTKNKPNCNACPMRGECRHFASAFASARLALPGPEENSIVSSTIPIVSGNRPAVAIKPLPLPPSGSSEPKEMGSIVDNCEPIVEEPATPEPEAAEVTESDIEDAFYEDPDEIPTIKLNLEEFTLNLHNYMQENMELHESDMSKALVALNPEAASIPTPKLKNVSRLRTEHQVYELPDSHPLLKWMDKREPDDPSPYLLAIWTPGETANSVQPPESRCGSQEPGKLCNEKTCFSCNSARETNAQTVRGTLLIPCRTAMRGSFPLNGTYFQVNEMFADHESSLNPIHVPRAWIWNLTRRTVYFGTSVSSIFKGLPTEGIQYCFWRGFVCVRGFDQKTRAPRPLLARLHFPASKLVKTKNEDK